MPRVFLVLAGATLAVFGALFYQYSAQQAEHATLMQYDQVLQEKAQEIYIQAQDWNTPIQVQLEHDQLEGDYAEMASFLIAELRDVAEERNQYLRDLKSVEWDLFLDIERLAQDQKKDYVETEAMLKAVTDIVKKYEQQLLQRETDQLAQLKALDIKQRYRQQLMQNLKQANAQQQNNALLSLEKQSLLKAKQLFAVMKQNPWQPRNGMFMFKEDATVKQFNILYKEMLNLNQQMLGVQQQNRAELERKLD